MKRFLLLGIAYAIKIIAFAGVSDSAYLFAYAQTRDEGRSGLLFAWSTDRQNWHPIGTGFGFVRSDYGRWGSEKRMINPVLFPDRNGAWHCIWDLDNNNGPVAYTTTKDLLSWMPQSYFVKEGDLKLFPAKQIDEERSKRIKVRIAGNIETGTINRVSRNCIHQLQQKERTIAGNELLWNETTAEDTIRFASLKPVTVSIVPEISHMKKISTMLTGAFFEDINYAADGGLYAELIQNRDFEYEVSDKEYRDPAWNNKKAWAVSGDGIIFSIDSVAAVHPNNPHYAVITTNRSGAALVNEGFDGIAVKAGARYNFSAFIRLLSGSNVKLAIRITDRNGTEIAGSFITTSRKDWKKVTTVLTAAKTVADARLEIVLQANTTVALDMVSLFPEKTFMNRKNGLRADLAAAIADLHPKFIRFPGGCVAHGDGIENIYHWKNTVGPLETRNPQRNLWGYHQTAGLGYYEYFQFCEDIGAEPVPVVAAGVPCQNSGRHGHTLGGQQGGIPLSGMPDYIQDVLDLIEWANGTANTRWGKIRAAAGHPQPFHLKYIGIGNEDLISDVFKERFTMIFKAVKERYPGITVIGTAGPFFEGPDYEEGWKLATQLKVPVVDEHYYVPPGWFIYNQDFYDRYDREKSKVYLGEYAAHLPGRPNNLETALAEALYLTALERNGDVVQMASYAPLLAKEGHTQWNPDLIYFNNTTVKPATGYYVQQLFGQNQGDQYIPAKAMFSVSAEKVKKRIAYSIVKDSKSNELIVKLVNLLPVRVTVSLEETLLQTGDAPVIKTVLQGRPDSREIRPVQSDISMKASSSIDLAPYSFTLLRMKLKI